MQHQASFSDKMTSSTLDSLYVYMSSEDSLHMYPDNTAAQFKLQLPERLKLDGGIWEVAVAEVEYPRHYIDNNRKPSGLYFEVDLCEASFVGGQKLSVLRRLPVDADNSGVTTLTFPHMYYVRLRQPEFDSIQVYIREPSMQLASFAAGTSSCTLHLKRTP